jgi:hypothetical protein
LVKINSGDVFTGHLFSHRGYTHNKIKEISTKSIFIPSCFAGLDNFERCHIFPFHKNQDAKSDDDGHSRDDDYCSLPNICPDKIKGKFSN